MNQYLVTLTDHTGNRVVRTMHADSAKEAAQIAVQTQLGAWAVTRVEVKPDAELGEDGDID